MKAPSLVLILAAVSIVLAGCTAQPQGGDLTDPFIGGTEGIIMSFQEGTPPREIFDNGDSTFAIGIRLQNQGESDIGSEPIIPNDNRVAIMEITGVNPLQFGNPQTVRDFQSEGITLTRMRKSFDGTQIAGAPDVMLFDGFRFNPDIVGNTEVRLRANLCYDYTTFTNTQVCMKSSTLETIQDNSICTLSGPRDVKNSGAPVHVTSLSQYPLGRDKIQIQFTVENVGTGMIFAPSEYQTFSSTSFFGASPCDPTQPNNPNRNVVYVRVRLNDDSSNALIRCNRLGDNSEGLVTLFAGSPAIVQCTMEVPPGAGTQAYTDTLRVDLDYMYYQFVQTPILIRDVSAGIN
jgi:hypothetical protein